MFASSQERDSNGNPLPIMKLSTPQILAVNAAVGAAVLSAALTRRFVRLQPTVDMFVMFTVAGDVTAATGHFLGAGRFYDMVVDPAATKISCLGANTAGVLYISEMG
jgi:hypothetical protein